MTTFLCHSIWYSFYGLRQISGVICIDIANMLIFAGEEMDFLELLKSFGLDMGSVASALGIDMAALNNMDQEVLLHLLTSQTQHAN